MLFSIFTILLLAPEFLVSALYLPNPKTKRSFTANPVIPQPFADPSTIQGSDGTWWTFSSDNNVQNVPVASSPDFETWSIDPSFDALPQAGNWTASDPVVWAPDVIQLSDGSYVMYYAAAWDQNDAIHCIGVATSTILQGPYQALPEPWVCPSDQGGAIDPTSFTDPSTQKQYVLYKIDGNTLVPGGSCGNAPPPGGSLSPTPIMLQEVSPSDGITPINTPIQILDRGPDDGPLIEAPSLVAVQAGGSGGDVEGEEGVWTYVLFFSSNCWNTVWYDVSYAMSVGDVTGGDGGYVKSSEALLVSGMGGLDSPGGLDIAPDGQHVVFHGDSAPGDATLRQLRTGKVVIWGEKVMI